MSSTGSVLRWLARAALFAPLYVLFLGFAATVSSAPTERQAILDAYANLPLTFVENRGQTNPQARFYATGSRYAFFMTREAIVLSLADAADMPRSGALALRFIGGNPHVLVEGEERVPGATSYFRGSDPADWRAGLPGYARIVYRDLWPGIDLVVHGQSGQLKYEFRVHPEADPADIRLEYAGADRVALDDDGALSIHTALGVLRDTAPVSYQTIDGERVPVESRYRMEDGAREYGFTLGAGYRADRELVIDPGLDYSTFLGGTGGDSGADIAVDAAGNVYVVGTTQSMNFPTTVGAFDRTAGDSINGPDAFVSKLNPSGTALIYSTYLGGSQFDFGRAVAVDSAGNAYVTGRTQSSNFPTTAGAFDRTGNLPQTPRPQVIEDVFVTKLNAAGSALVYSTYIGGTDNDEARAIAVDGAGNALVTGETVSADYPTTSGALDTVRGGEYDVFVTKVNGNGSALVYSTFLGGAVTEIANAIAIDAANDAWVAGSTRSADFPVTPGAFDTTHGGGFDAFVAKLSPSGSTLVASTFLGGSGFDDGTALALDTSGNAYVAGGTGSPEYPVTAGAFDTAFPASGSASFVTKLNNAAAALVYSTFLRDGSATAVAVDSAGNAWLTGATSSEAFPVTLDGFDISFNGVTDAFVARLNASGAALAYATFLGGSKSEYGVAIGLDAQSNVYLTGVTHSAEFPTTVGAFDRAWAGDPLIFWGDGFVAKLDPAAGSPTFPEPTLAAMALSPASLEGGGTSTGTVTLSSAAPSGGVSVTLADDSPVVTVPGSVAVPAGATTATFVVTTSAVSPNATVATISGTLGTLRSAALTILPAPPLLESLTLAPSMVEGGDTSTATVRLSRTQAVPTVISIDPIVPSAPATVPASVTVPAGAMTASFQVATTPVSETFNLNIHVRLQGASEPGPSAVLLISPAASTNVVLATLSLSSSTVVGGSFVMGTVTLSGAAPSGGAVVALSDNSTAATTSSSVTVPAGATSATFIVTSTVVFAPANVTLSAMFNGVIRTAALTVTPQPAGASLSALNINPSSLAGGSPATGTVTLTGAAPSGGAFVTLSSDTAAVTVAAGVSVAAGASSATFSVATGAVTSATTAIVSAVYAGVTRTAGLTVNPAGTSPPSAPSLVSPASSATPSQPVAFDWSNVTNATGYEIQIDTSSSFPAPLVASQLVAISQASIGGLPAQQLWWRVRARNASGVFGAFSSARRFTPRAAPAAATLSAVAMSPTSVAGGATSQGTVTLTSAAPAGGAVVALSSNAGAVAVPASVTVAAGSTSVAFTAATTAVTSATPATISAVFGGVTRTATLTVNPSGGGGTVTLTVTATGRSGERVTSSPAGINVAVGNTASASFAPNTTITLRATDDRDVIWSGACSSGGNRTETCRFTITGNASVTANVR